MGGGVSLMEGVEELMTTTILIGRAISSMTFPGMYRIYDFHSKKAPKLKNARQFTFFANESDDEEEDDGIAADPAEYERFFKVTVNGDAIYLEDPLQENEAGWTPLHACCMSTSTVSAGLALIEYAVSRRASLETRTRAGPGTFNRGWTALQMACAYGIDALAEALVAAGADANATNCYGFSCLHEAAHRGYHDIVRALLAAPAHGYAAVDLEYLPEDEANMSSPFASAPPQTALGEAARCGFPRIVSLLLTAGSHKDRPNRIGWTALHEAAFYHRTEVVKVLLLAGADASLRTSSGALAYQLAGLGEIRQMLTDMGGPAAVPAEGDTIDMVQVLTQLTMLDMTSGGEDGGGMVMTMGTGAGAGAGGMMMPVMVFAPKQQAVTYSTSSTNTNSSAHAHGNESGNSRAMVLAEGSSGAEAKGQGQLLLQDSKTTSSSGSTGTGTGSGGNKGLLGDLPSLSATSPSKGVQQQVSPSRRAEAKHTVSSSNKKKRASSSSTSSEVPPDMPAHFLCALTRRPMSDPVRSPYGQHYDRTAIAQWMAAQGRICPLTGAPLAEGDLAADEQLAQEIRQWILKRSLAPSAAAVGPSDRAAGQEQEGLYDF